MNTENGPGINDGSAASVSKPDSALPPGKPGWSTFAVYGLALCAGIAVAGICFKFFLKSTPVPKKRVAVTAVRKQAPAVQKAPALVPAEPVAPVALSSEAAPRKELSDAQEELPSFVVSGVFSSEQGDFAILNNQVVKVGGSIDGVKLIGVTSHEALLELKGRKFKVSTREN